MTTLPAAPQAEPRSVPQLDPTLTLALALRATAGAYALLLGSGLSRAAGVPTGWDIVLDLLRRVAPAGTDDTPEGLERWYRATHGGEPDYSTLVEAVADTPGERRDRLRGYFEPTPDEREQGLKLPTKAHRAVARLVARGYVRVVVTTNFDQLLETALRDEGVAPAVISTPDAVAGAMPLQHERATVIKLHGDYTDVRIKNTPTELAAYDPALDALLDRVLDEYGLVVCGWSAAWDDALRAAITRAPNRRFSTFWATKGTPGTEARRLIDARHARLIQIESADAFFDAVEQQVTSLEALDRTDPISTAVAVASLKRYLPRPEERIRMHDLVMGEVEAVRRRTAAAIPTAEAPSAENFGVVVPRIEAAAETLCALLAAGGYWGDADQSALWVTAVERTANTDAFAGGYTTWVALPRYPAQLAWYAAGIAAAAARNDDALARLVLRPVIRVATTTDTSAPRTLSLAAVIDHDVAQQFLPGRKDRLTPVSDRLHATLRAPLRDVVPDDAAYDAAFDRFELLVALAYRNGQPLSKSSWFPVGRAAWGWQRAYGGTKTSVDALGEEIATDGADWAPLRHGLFGGSAKTLGEMWEALREQVRRSPY